LSIREASTSSWWVLNPEKKKMFWSRVAVRSSGMSCVMARSLRGFARIRRVSSIAARGSGSVSREGS
jgi:hypothetical protein